MTIKLIPIRINDGLVPSEAMLSTAIVVVDGEVVVVSLNKNIYSKSVQRDFIAHL